MLFIRFPLPPVYVEALDLKKLVYHHQIVQQQGRFSRGRGQSSVFFVHICNLLHSISWNGMSDPMIVL